MHGTKFPSWDKVSFNNTKPKLNQIIKCTEFYTEMLQPKEDLTTEVCSTPVVYSWAVY